jgi:hypothetical protein
MTQLWIANTTNGIWHFTYRIGQFDHHREVIRAGKQICLDHLQKEECDIVVKQNAIYGMREADERSKRRGFTTLVYRFDNPVTAEQMLETYKANQEVRDAEAAERLKNAALALSNNIVTTLHRNTGVDKEQLRPARVEMETVEVPEHGGAPSVSAGVEIVRPGVQPKRGRIT